MSFGSVTALYVTVPAFPHAQPDEHAWAAAAPLDLAALSQYQPIAAYSELQPPFNGSCSVPLTPALRPSIPSVPVYTVAYSLAGALTPIDAPRPASPAPALAGAVDSSAVCYSPPDRLSSGKEYFYKPEPSTSGSSCSLSPSPPPLSFIAVKKEELPSTSLSLSGPGSPSRKKTSHRDKTNIVTGDKQFVCDICGVVFIRKHDGERHRRSHTGERPFPCHGGCGKAFRRADARSRHWGVYRECEWRHTLYLEGTPEGARRERRLLKRAKRAELVLQGVARPLIERILKMM